MLASTSSGVLRENGGGGGGRGMAASASSLEEDILKTECPQHHTVLQSHGLSAPAPYFIPPQNDSSSLKAECLKTE